MISEQAPLMGDPELESAHFAIVNAWDKLIAQRSYAARASSLTQGVRAGGNGYAFARCGRIFGTISENRLALP